MNFFIFLFVFFITSAAINESNFINNNSELVECPCPQGSEDECIKQKICVYGINDQGEIFYNGKNDDIDLTKIALQRKSEINNGDDVLVNLYNPKIKPMAIFYYGCQECDDLKQIGNFTISKLRIFLLSLYNQRMKHNIKYSQSDFVYFSSSNAMVDDEQQQPMPEISVRPFWKYRLMLNQSCARKQNGFTQKNYIPAFLTQDLCILDYKYNHYLHYNQSYRTQNGEIIYSPTLSYMDLYSYNILPNSIDEIPFDSFGKQEVCKMTFNLESTEQSIRFFCVCPTHSCTLRVTQKDPLHCCPYLMNVTINGEIEYSSLNQTTDYMPVDEFFLQNETTYCDFRLKIFASTYFSFIGRVYYFLPDGYTFDTSYSFKAKWYCPFLMYTKENIEPIYTTFYKNDTNQLRNVFLKSIIDHTKIINTPYSIGANCTAEGPLSHSTYSSSFGLNSTLFPCYKYYDLSTYYQIFPMMGINMIPINIIAKGKDCYYYNVKIHSEHAKACTNPTYQFQPLMTIVGCPENNEFDSKEIIRMKKIINACPTMKPNETQWKYETHIIFTTNFCGQFLRGLKFENGKYVPKEIELRTITMEDFEMTGMSNVSIYHGCGFNPAQNLTLCTCFAALGECDNLYHVGKVHLLRYLPFKD